MIVAIDGDPKSITKDLEIFSCIVFFKGFEILPPTLLPNPVDRPKKEIACQLNKISS